MNQQDLLKQTSRSFYLTLRVLPSAIRPQIGLAYLLARATDTVADTRIVPVAQRLQSLHALRGRIAGESNAPLNFGALAQQQGSHAERALLSRIEEALAALDDCAPPDQQRIRDVLATIISGQELDLVRFGAATEADIISLQIAAELDDYTFRVAGCVGEFWTRMCRAHLFPNAPLVESALLADAVRFGKGLQLVNILRDLPADLRQGRCYLPTEQLAPLGLTPRDLLDPGAMSRLRPLYDHYLDLAAAHLVAGWRYTNTLPRGQVRVRLACAWPILIGVRSLARLRLANVLDATQRVKMDRREVRTILLRSLLAYPRRRAWEQLFAACHQ